MKGYYGKRKNYIAYNEFALFGFEEEDMHKVTFKMQGLEATYN